MSQSTTARLAQSAERKALNLVVVGSSATVDVLPTWVALCCLHYMRSGTFRIRIEEGCGMGRGEWHSRTEAKECRRFEKFGK